MCENIIKIERKFIEFQPLKFDELILLYNKHGVTESHDGIDLYVNIVTNTKPSNFDSNYANILKNSRYDSKAKNFVSRLNDYTNSLVFVIKDNLYDEFDSHIVIQHNDSGSFIRLDAGYSSYNGLDFFGQCWYEVTPKEVISIEYT